MDEKSLCPRLIDFIVLVGRRGNSRLQPHGAPHFLRAGEGAARLRQQLNTVGGVANPELLRRYPSDNHKDFELPTDVTYFCQPEGCVTIGSSQQRWNIARDTTIFVFTLTEKDSAKIRYGITLNFFLKFGRTKSGTPHKQTQKTPPSSTYVDTSHTDDVASTSISNVQQQNTTGNIMSKRKSTGACSSSLTSLCLISHHPFLNTFRDLLILLRQIIDSCNFRCNCDPSLPRNAVWAALLGHWSGHGAVPERVMDEIRQIETWILMLLSSPVPVPGKTKVVIEVLPSAIMQMLVFALPDHTRFSLVEFPLHLPIELLGVDLVTRLLAAIMLENKVILQSRNYNAVSMCVMALVALLYPLEYMFPVIPLLPVFMPAAEQLLLAPTPYIIGVPASFFAVKNIGVPSDVLLVDLDTNELTVSHEVANIPQFPEPEATNLKEAFRKALGKATTIDKKVISPIRTMTSDSLADISRSSTNFHLNLTHQHSLEQQNEDEKGEEIRSGAEQAPSLNNVSETGSISVQRSSEERNEISATDAYEFGHVVDNDAIDVAVRVAMVQFYDSANIFANFSEHTRTLRLYPRPVIALQNESFLRSRPVPSEFITELCKTQSVEYFAESLLCPRNETYVRVHTGITSPAEIGDKAKWFSDQLMPIHFNAYPHNATLADALAQMRAERPNNLLSDSDDEDTSDLESSFSGGMDESLYSDSSFDSRSPTNYERYKPLSEMAADFYNAPKHLKLPQSHSGLSIGSSISSGRSSPESSISVAASVVDSEADFVRLAENLALKSDSKGEFTFDHTYADEELQNSLLPHPQSALPFMPSMRDSVSSTSSLPTVQNATSSKALKNVFTNSQEPKKVPPFMGALNGYAEKSHGMLSQMFRKTAPKAQAIRDKAVRPLAEAAATKMEHGQHLMQQKKATNNVPKSSAATATQQRKGQQAIAEVCEQVLAGQSIGVFTYPRVKRLLEDENLRELACSKLNLNLENRFSEDDFEPDVQLTRNQYKGYLKLLVAAVLGLENSFRAPGSGGLASMFHVLEIAHTHFWAECTVDGTPSADTPMSVTSSSIESAFNVNSLSAVPPLNLANGHSSDSASQASESPRSTPPTGAPPTIPPPLPSFPPQGAPPPLPQRSVPPPLPPRQRAEGATNAIPQFTQTTTDNEANHKPLSNGSVTNVDKPQQQQKQQPVSLSVGVPSMPSDGIRALTSSTNSDSPRHYLYTDLLVACNKSDVWQNLTFYENAFFDVVAQEREIIGMDQEPAEMIDRYTSLCDSERKRLELDEDRILATLLHNLTAYMLLCRVPIRSIQQKVRRLLGKAHIGLVYSKKINQLLDELQNYQNSRIPLKIVGSRLVQKQSFTVHNGSAEGETLFLEICDDALILRELNGAISERWWYERLVNMTYSPKTRMLCLWRRQDDHVHMHKFYTKKCRHLYASMKSAMERAAARGKVTVAGRDLGGEFPIHDIEHNEGGLLQVRIDGISLLFANRQEFVDLLNIKKCNTFGGNVFVLEELNRSDGKLIQRRYISTMAWDIAWSLHRIFSVNLALGECDKRDALYERGVVLRRTTNVSESRVILMLAQKPTAEKAVTRRRDNGVLCLSSKRHNGHVGKMRSSITADGISSTLPTILEYVGEECNATDWPVVVAKSPKFAGMKSRSLSESEMLGRDDNISSLSPPRLLLNDMSFSGSMSAENGDIDIGEETNVLDSPTFLPMSL